jgi:two-component sensor histidine kinase
MLNIPQAGAARCDMGELLTAPIPASPASIDLVLESNHRVANNLAALAATFRHKLRAIEAGPELVPRRQVGALVNDMVGKIIAVSRLYRSFAEHAVDGAREAPDVVGSVLEDLARSGIFGDRLRLGARTPGAPCRLDATQAFHLTLAVSEIVSNAVKHAHPTGLPVELSVESRATPDGGALLLIRDDGLGLPEGFVEGCDGGLGLQLIRTLVESAGGALEVRSDALGLTYAIRFAPGAEAA